MRRGFAFSMLMLLFTATSAWALTELTGDQAREFIGDAKSYMVTNHFGYNLLERSHRDAMHGRFSDGVLFVPAPARVDFLRRKDSDVHVIFNAPAGRQAYPVTDNDWVKKLSNALADDNPNPHVFLDDSRNVLGIVYTGKATRLVSAVDAQGLLDIKLTVEGATDAPRARRMGPFGH